MKREAFCLSLEFLAAIGCAALWMKLGHPLLLFVSGMAVGTLWMMVCDLLFRLRRSA